MKRDMDLARDILLKIEDAEAYLDVVETFVPHVEGERNDKQAERIYQHAVWLKEAGFITGQTQLSPLDFSALLTWHGCEFLDTIRDVEIWKKTKAGAKTVGLASVEFIWEIAKGYAKEAAKSRLGLPL